MSRRTFVSLASASVGAAGAGLYPWRIEPHWLEIVRRSLPVRHLASDLVGRRLIQLSDIPVGDRVDDRYVIDTFEQVAALDPDIVVLTGDATSYHRPILQQRPTVRCPVVSFIRPGITYEQRAVVNTDATVLRTPKMPKHPGSRLALILAVGFIIISALHAQDWNQWRGPTRTGVAGASAFTPPATWPDRPTKVWQVKVGTGHSSPVVSAGRAYQFSRLGEQEVVTALDIASGKQIWQQRYDAPYQMNPAAQAHGKGPKSTPAVADSRLFTFGIDGALTALDAASGKVLWRKHYAKQFDAASPDFGVALSPVLLSGLLIVHAGGNKSGALMALDAATGAEKWSWKEDGPAYASPVVAAFDKTSQVITQSRSHVIGINAADGSLLWRIPFTTAYDQNIVTPVIADDLLIYSGIDKPLTAVRIQQAAGKWTTKQVWQNADVPMYMSSPVVSGGFLVGLTHRNKGQFFAVDLKTGKTLWTTRGREAENAALVAAGDFLIATTTEAELVVARRDAVKFDVIKRYTIADSPVWAHPAPAGRGVLIKDAETLAYWMF